MPLLIALISVRIGARPADDAHPYGHGRVETMAASVQAALIGSGGIFIVASAVYRIIEPPDHIGHNIGLVAMLIAAGVNVALVQYTSRVARETNSPAIASEARHLWTNVVQAGAVMLGLALVAITDEVAFDAIVALGLGVYLLWIAGHIFASAVGDFLDKRLSHEEIEQIHDAIVAEGVDGYHQLRTRRAGQVRHIDFHITLPGDMTVDDLPRADGPYRGAHRSVVARQHRHRPRRADRDGPLGKPWSIIRSVLPGKDRFRSV